MQQSRRDTHFSSWFWQVELLCSVSICQFANSWLRSCELVSADKFRWPTSRICELVSANKFRWYKTCEFRQVYSIVQSEWCFPVSIFSLVGDALRSLGMVPSAAKQLPLLVLDHITLYHIISHYNSAHFLCWLDWFVSLVRSSFVLFSYMHAYILHALHYITQ